MAADRLVAQMLARVTKARQLTALSPVADRTLARAGLLRQVREHVERELPREVVQGQGETLRGLGLIPRDYDFEKGVFALLESQLAGYYEPADKTMYLAGDLGESEAEATLAHELVHALQDQHYNLGPRLVYKQDNGDLSSAVQSLAEGDAMSAMLDVIVGRSSLELPEKALAMQIRAGMYLSTEAASIPPALKSSLIAPYIDGLLFVQALRRRGGWAEVDRAWVRPPATTEQLLHLDKYDAQEPALSVPAPPTDALGGGFHVLFTELEGEQSVRVAFEDWAKREDAAAMAAGWGGDRISVMAREKDGKTEHLVVWWIRYDEADPTCEKARHVYRSLAHAMVAPGKSAQSFLSSKPTASSNKLAETTCRERSDLGPLAVGHFHCDVVISAGPYPVGDASPPPSPVNPASASPPKPPARRCSEVQAWLAKALPPSPPAPLPRRGEGSL